MLFIQGDPILFQYICVEKSTKRLYTEILLYFVFFKLIFIGIQSTYNVVLVSDIQQSELVLHKDIHLCLGSSPIGPLKY